ncbi:PucR family transcriptional regulator [Paenibacillus tengchongensis]|uniref:PucR family transcriptional regulator n=1 Tax=Paenibacillus tengchongensis TaxID=2608684 RepID=UPI0016522613|nr:helix-turn-helix domain-containing protein [Paenibacillus tengchongensis]
MITASVGGLSAVQEDFLLFVQGISREEMRQYVDRYLGALLAGDGCDAELLLTLETFVSCSGQMNEMSAKLYIHRNTAAYRLEKLERLLGMPLREPGNLLLLNLVFLFRRLLEPGAEALSGLSQGGNGASRS